MPDAFIEFLLNAWNTHWYSCPLHAVSQLGGFSRYPTFPTRVIGEMSGEAGPRSHRTPMTPANVCADCRGDGTSGPHPWFLGAPGFGDRWTASTWSEKHYRDPAGKDFRKQGSLKAERTFLGREVQWSQARQDRCPRWRALQVERPGGLKRHSLGRAGGRIGRFGQKGSSLGGRGLLRVGGEHPVKVCRSVRNALVLHSPGWGCGWRKGLAATDVTTHATAAGSGEDYLF